MKIFKKKSSKVILTLAIFIFTLALGKNDSLASPILETGVDVSAFDSFQRDLYIDQGSTNKDQALANLKNIRAKMWDENVIYTTDTSNKEGKRLRETLEEYNITSKEAYLNLISWSKGLENIALQRAFEQIPTGLSHTRPNGSDWYSAKSFNVETYAEILAGHSANMSPDLAFSLWFSEYEDLKANAGVSNAANGHLHTILNPEFRSFAFAKVNGQDKFNYGVGEFSYDPSENQNSLGHVGTYTMYLGSYKPSTGSSSNSSDDEKIKLYLEKLEKALEDSRMTVDAVNMLKKNYPNTIKNIVDDLDKLVAKAIKLQEEGQKILDSYK